MMGPANGEFNHKEAKKKAGSPNNYGLTMNGCKCAMVKVVASILGDGKPPTFNRNPYNGYINPYYWVDEFIPDYMEIMGVDRPWHKRINHQAVTQTSLRDGLISSLHDFCGNFMGELQRVPNGSTAMRFSKMILQTSGPFGTINKNREQKCHASLWLQMSGV